MDNLSFEDILAKYPRIAIGGCPKSGKSTLVEAVTDRPVIHTDDYMGLEWSKASAQVVEECNALDSFVVEGVRVPHALRKGLQVDAVIYRTTPFLNLSTGQEIMAKGCFSIFEHWRGQSSVPVFYL